MKKLRSLYLIASEDGFRLVQTHEPDLLEISHKKAANFSDVAYSYPSEQSHNHGGPGAPGFNTGSTADKSEQERSRLARHIVAALEEEWAKGTHDRIIIAAGPKMLGELRSALPKALQPHVAQELHKDLMKIPMHELGSHFAEVSET
ncbi:MAG: host attachment protein [Cypionkella sp.]